jgi:RNA recognition motif-containing protein
MDLLCRTPWQELRNDQQLRTQTTEECCNRLHAVCSGLLTIMLLLLLLQVRLHTDKATGKSKGYAHVHFADEAGLDK